MKQSIHSSVPLFLLDFNPIIMWYMRDIYTRFLIIYLNTPAQSGEQRYGMFSSSKGNLYSRVSNGNSSSRPANLTTPPSATSCSPLVHNPPAWRRLTHCRWQKERPRRGQVRGVRGPRGMVNGGCKWQVSLLDYIFCNPEKYVKRDGYIFEIQRQREGNEIQGNTKS